MAQLANGLLGPALRHWNPICGYYSTVHVLLLAFMSLCRIKIVEQLRGKAPGEFGKLMGLDRVPMVRCLRSKLTELSQDQAAQRYASALAAPWRVADPDSLGILYVDGHMRVESWAEDQTAAQIGLVPAALPARHHRLLGQGSQAKDRALYPLGGMTQGRTLHQTGHGTQAAHGCGADDACRAETALCALLRPVGMDTAEARRLLQDFFVTEADILPDACRGVLEVEVHRGSRPAGDRALEWLFEQFNKMAFTFPGTDFVLHHRLVGQAAPAEGPMTEKVSTIAHRGKEF